MRSQLKGLCATVVLLSTAMAQQPVTKAPVEFGNTPPPAGQSQLENLLQSKIKAEWEALKAKDKKAYGDLLADDYQGVEVDGRGERTKLQAMNEVPENNVASYTLWGFKLIPLGNDAAFATYEATMRFPANAALRYSRVYITELWVKRNGEWKEIHYQETHVK